MVARAEKRPMLAEGIRDVYRRVGFVPTEDAALFTTAGVCIRTAWPLLAILADRRGLAAAVAFTEGDPATALDRMAEALDLHPDYVRGFTEGYAQTGRDLTYADLLWGMTGQGIDEPAEVDLYESGLGWTEGMNAKLTVLLSPSLFPREVAR